MGHAKDWTSDFSPLPRDVLMAAIKDFDLVGRLSRHQHQPTGPTWECTTCYALWPCDDARRELVLDLGWVRVPIFMAVMMERAAGEVTNTYPHQLWDRFIKWTYPLVGAHDHRLQ